MTSLTVTSELTEAEAVRALVGKLVLYERPTVIGKQVIVGDICMPITIDLVDGKETVTLVTVEGMIVSEYINGCPLPLDIEEPFRDEMVPLDKVQIHE